MLIIKEIFFAELPMKTNKAHFHRYNFPFNNLIIIFYYYQFLWINLNLKRIIRITIKVQKLRSTLQLTHMVRFFYC